jgi:alkylated DNA repair dioxygenase AlkB
VTSLSLGAPIVMDFTDPDGKKHPHLLERRSLFVLSGEARYEWKHGIAPRKSDSYQGNLIERQRRISCTFRNTLLLCGQLSLISSRLKS